MSDKSPMDMMLDAVEFQVLPAPEAVTDGIPYATHRGVLTIMGCELECFRLSNGQAVFTQESFERFIAG